jgi:nitroreductase
MSELIQKMQWRYATKKMEAGKPVPQDKVERILEAARLAPTSSGLQPYEIIVIRNAALREQIKAVANNPGANHRWLAPAGVCGLGHLHRRTHQHRL